MQSFRRLWKTFLGLRTLLTYWPCLVDDWRNEFTFLVAVEARDITLSNVSLLTTYTRLYENFCTCFMTKVRGPLKYTCKDGNSCLRLEISSKDVLRRPISQRRLAEFPNVKIWCLFFVCEFPRFWLRYTEIWKFMRVWHHGERPMC